MTDKVFDTYKKVLLGFIFISILYWLAINFLSLPETPFYTIFGGMLAILPLLGALAGLHAQNEWGGFKSTVGRSIIFISLSLLMWSIGQTLYLVLSLTMEEVPYPGLPDLFFILIDPFYALAILLIMKYSGALHNLKNISISRMLFLVVPLVSIYLNIKLFFGEFSVATLQQQNIFDLIYTFGSIILTTLIIITISLCFNKLGGRLMSAVYVFFIGFILQYVGDVLYSILETQESFPVNGNVADFVFFLSIACMTIGVAKFSINAFSMHE